VMVKCGMLPVGSFVHPRIDREVVRYMIGRDAWASRA